MKKILILAFVFCMFISNSFAFLDDNNFGWAKDAVNKWSLKGYVSGYPDGTFRGNQYITRAEVIAIINKLNNSSVVVSKRPSKDINNDNWFFNDMGKAVEAGLILVDSDGNLYPNNYATREEVMVILSKLLNISYSGNLDNARVNQFFDRDKISSNEYYRVAGIVEEGFVSGYEDGTLKPQDNITRAEFMCILNNAVSDVYTYGKYNNRKLNGNIIINGENVKITNSEINGKVFVLDGAKSGKPILTNTMVSKGINSRVGEILIDNTDEYQTVSEYNYNNPKEPNELVIAKLSYSETDWTNDDVDIKVKFSDKNAEAIDGSKITVDKNGEYAIEYLYEGKVRKIFAKVENIDNIKPIVTAMVENKGDYAIVTVQVSEDGLSPISQISCGEFINKKDETTGEVSNTFNILKGGNYTISVTDEAGNTGTTNVQIAEMTHKISATFEPKDGYSIITVNYSDSGLNPVTEIACSNGVTNKIDIGTGVLDNTFIVDKSGTYTITLKDVNGNIDKVDIVIPQIIRSVTATHIIKDGFAEIMVEFEDNIENPITEIVCSNGVVNLRDEVNGTINKVIKTGKSGEHTITIKDKAGNIGKTVVNIGEITRKFVAEVVENDGSSDIIIKADDSGVSPIVEISCDNGEKHIANNGVVDNKFTVDKIGTYIFTIKDEAGNTGEVSVDIDEIKYVVYGIKRSTTSNTSKWERIENSVGLTALAKRSKNDLAKNDFDSIYPWSDIKTYNYDIANKKITAWIGDDSFKFDGSNGEVLTLIPEFYYKHFIENGYEYFYITRGDAEGYTKSKEFSIGRYEMSIIDGVGHSFSGQVPSSTFVTETRNSARATGDGFGLMDHRYFVIQMLYLVEYADFNSQEKLGKGMTDFIEIEPHNGHDTIGNDGTGNGIIVVKGLKDDFEVGHQISLQKTYGYDYVFENRTITEIRDYNENGIVGCLIRFDGPKITSGLSGVLRSCSQKTGSCDELMMSSGCLKNDGRHSVIYRGIENLVGNVSEVIDGINIKATDRTVYICGNPDLYETDKFDGEYKLWGEKMARGNGSVTKLHFDEENSLIQLPIEVDFDASMNAYLCDFSRIAHSNSVLCIGGTWIDEDEAGLWCFSDGAFSDKVSARIIK